MRGRGKPSVRAIPRPDREVELRSSFIGPVTEYTLSQEELDKLREKDGPACGLTRQALIEAIASGETLSSTERAWKMKYNTIHVWVKKWGLSGITAERARELLASEAEGAATAETAPTEDVSAEEATAAPTTELKRLEKRMMEAHLEATRAWSEVEELREKLAASAEVIVSRDAVIVDLMERLDVSAARIGAYEEEKRRPRAFDRIDAAIDMLQELSVLKTPALQSVIEERQRQNEKWGLQNHVPVVWVSILGEEFGELCEAVNETVFDNGPEARMKGGYANIRTEAVQVAAVAVQLVEMIDRQESV